MRCIVHDFKTGFIGLSLCLRKDEIAKLRGLLKALADDDLGHFHFRRDEWDRNDEEGLRIADVEISVLGEDESENLTLGG